MRHAHEFKDIGNVDGAVYEAKWTDGSGQFHRTAIYDRGPECFERYVVRVDRNSEFWWGESYDQAVAICIDHRKNNS
jgi:hypothetical protein